MMVFDVIIVGGGAAGFFGAIQIALKNPCLNILILEKGKEVLAKVKISGGGRCNLTHAEFDPNEIINAYPRGNKELRGPFHTYCSGDVMAFFESKGVSLKIEADGRVFPESDTSQTIIDCFVKEAKRLGIKVNTSTPVIEIHSVNETHANWHIKTLNTTLKSKILFLATGNSAKIWKQLASLGHSIVTPVPSLFTFNIKDSRIYGLMGVATNASVQLLDMYNQPIKLDKTRNTVESGPLLITHWGMSGPTILKLSAWGSRELARLNYHFKVKVNWVPEIERIEVEEILKDCHKNEGKKQFINTNPLQLPKRLWHKLLEAAHIEPNTKWATLNKKQLKQLELLLTESVFIVTGKSTFKEEFVSAGGVALNELNFKTYESKLYKNLFLAGEILNIDAITGGYNFQNAWTGAFIAAQTIVKRFSYN